ncbi:MAG: HD domain-containing protein, partial [Rudaea sp.]
MKTPASRANAALDRFIRDVQADSVLAPVGERLVAARAIADFARLEAEVAGALQLLDDLDLDLATRAAYVLHALREHGRAAEIPGDAGNALRELLEGQQAAEKVGELHQAHAGNAEGLRRLLLAIIRDLRVVFILLARALARLRAAEKMQDAQRRAQAQLTVDLFAPLANRLGIWQLKWELEDLAFRYLQPETYRRIVRLVDEREGNREAFISTTIRALRSALADAGIVAEIAGRPKHYYSIWKKMQRKGGDFYSLYDIRAVRVLVDDVAACYAALGIVHSLWPPIPTEFDDYIARPKGNHYQSLHTAVVGPQGKNLEVQIRTHDMHAFAERGVAAHWRYKEATAADGASRPRIAAPMVDPRAPVRARAAGRSIGTHGVSSGGGDQSFERKIAWMRQLLDARDDHDDESTLVAAFRTDA